MAAERSYQNKTIFMNRILDEFVLKIQGADNNKVIGNNPEDVIFVGKLSPRDVENSDLSSQTNISRIGVDLFVKSESIKDGKIIITPKGDFFYRVFPSLEEQQLAFIQKARSIYGIDIETFDELKNYLETNELNYEDEMELVYQKESIQDLKIEIDIKNILNEEKGFGYQSLSREERVDNKVTTFIDNKVGEVSLRENYYRIIREKVRVEDLLTNSNWEDFLSKNSTVAKNPKWDFGIDCEIRSISETVYKVSVSIFNLTSKDDHRKDKSRINTIFNSGLDVELSQCTLEAITLPYFEDDYKYDKKQIAIGINCTVIQDKENKNKLTTTHLPIFEQYRLKTRNDIKVTFDNLIKTPDTELIKVYNEMLNEIQKWEKELERKKAQDELTVDGIKQFQEEIADFRREINRFYNGIQVIKRFGMVRNAFILMNRAFSRSAKGYDSWRLFQIVFIVSLIPDVCTSEYSEDELLQPYIDKVDLLYFPTGGGKTEAFLGITIFTVFFDRLRGKNAGISSIIKYPLRLLSVQQVQRVADILAEAELIRREDEHIKDSDPFSLGYYVGDNNTPNKITQNIAQNLLNKSVDEMNEEYKVIDTCPFCRSKKINVEYQPERIILIHRCLEADCPSGGVLPFYMVDREIYRFLPSVLISTIDKFASIGLQVDFRNLMGQVALKCRKHGYSSRLQCSEREEGLKCEENSLWEQVQLKDPAPTLFIQDELHLIRESLGVYNAHYESLIQYVIKELSASKKKIKIIGATATISAYREQSHHLYLKDPIRFPSASPFLDNNFYSYIDYDEVHRKILGFAPFGKAIINSVVYSMKYLKQIIWKYFKDPRIISNIKGMDLRSEEEALEILENYWIFLQYNNVKLDGNKVIGALDDPINTELKREGIQPFEPRKMTGDDTFQDVRKILAEVETSENIFDDLNLITATSMISHGVDADRFNLMFFFGMPNNTAEYIQAYSRVGRKHPGLVFMIMRPSRERDQSYLKNFIKFHEFKDILVEPVPINRWASKAIERTFSGILSALILTYYDFQIQNQTGKNIYMMSQLQEAINNGYILKEELIQRVKASYQSLDHSLGKVYDEWIETAVNKFYDNIKYEDFNRKNERDAYIIEGMERLGFLKPMSSLRDTDNPIIVEMR